MARRIKISAAQATYLAAKAKYEAAYEAHRAYSDLMDAEGERLGLEGPYCILPDGHPMWIEAQRLLDVENAAMVEFRTATNALFDWSLTTVFARMGTPAQKASITEAVEKVKKMSHVERFHREMVDLCMKFAP